MDTSLLLTFDLDWAPEHVLEDFQSLLPKKTATFTCFCTHASEQVSSLITQRTETGLHPNLLGATDEAKRFKECHSLFPKSKGVRTHRLYPAS